MKRVETIRTYLEGEITCRGIDSPGAHISTLWDAYRSFLKRSTQFAIYGPYGQIEIYTPAAAEGAGCKVLVSFDLFFSVELNDRGAPSEDQWVATIEADAHVTTLPDGVSSTSTVQSDDESTLEFMERAQSWPALMRVLTLDLTWSFVCFVDQV